VSGANSLQWDTHQETLMGVTAPVTIWRGHYTWFELTDLPSSPSCDPGQPNDAPEGDSGSWHCTWHNTFHAEDEGDYYYVDSSYVDNQWNHSVRTEVSRSESRYIFHVGGDHVTCPVALKGEAIDQDDPKNTTYVDLASPGLVYGGEQAVTADKLRVRALTLGAVARYRWSVSGPDAARFPAPDPSSELWDLGAVAAKPGTLHLHVDVDYVEGGSGSANLDIEVGVRTNDTLAIGWIDPRLVTVSPAGVSDAVQRLLPPLGMGFADPVGSAAWLGSVATGVLGDNLTATERRYVLNWLFKYSANAPPPESFAGPADLDAYAAVATGYKLINRFQVKYRTAGLPVFSAQPTVLHQLAADGTTIDPILRQSFPGVANPFFNDRIDGDTSSISHLNEGSPDAMGVKLFNRLMQPNHVTWNDIGSRISFRVADGGKPKVEMQLYPTYFIYGPRDDGGWSRVETLPQAAEPSANFTDPSFPKDPTLGLLLRRSDR
jgi:hypothetical protein